MNAPLTPPQRDAREIPGCIARREESAIFAWFSTQRLLIVKDGDQISLSADDILKLARFVDANAIESQLS